MIPHIHSVVLECLRRYPNVPGVLVTATQDFVLEKYKILKNQLLLFLTTVTNFSDNLYEDPFEFKWERYFYGDKEKLFPSGVFGRGEHSCLGRHIAVGMMYILVASILHFFDLEVVFLRKNLILKTKDFRIIRNKLYESS